jgi:uncharacterized protein
MVRHILGNAATSFSVEKFYRSLKSQGLTISKDTVHKLLGYLEDCFLVRTLWMESASERQRMVNPRKIYPVDPGFMPLYDRTGRKNTAHALETAVLIELQRRGCEVTYVTTPQNHEVDFLAISPDGESLLIQVCTDLNDPETTTRKLRALKEAAPIHPNATPLLLTLTHPTIPAPEDIQILPAWQWMLRDNLLPN